MRLRRTDARASAVSRLGATVLASALLAFTVGCAAETVEPTANACDVGSPEVLAAQSVPSATAVPCVADLDEWRATDTEFSSSGSTFQLTTRQADSSWRIEFSESCDPGDTAPILWSGEGAGAAGATELDVTAYEQIDEGRGNFRITTWLVFEGGCVVSALDLPDNRLRPVIVEEAQEALRLLPRGVVNAHVERITDGELQLDP